MDDDIKIYSKFVSIIQNGEEVSFRVQNLTIDRLEEVVVTMLNNNLNEEAFLKASGISKNIEAVTEMQHLYYSLLKYAQNPCLICCIDDERAKIVGISILHKDINEDFTEEMIKEYTSPEMRAYFRIIKTTREFCDPFDSLNIDVYLRGVGLYVKEDYRGCGVAARLLEARKTLCQELSIPVTGGWFSGMSSQKAAEKAGYEMLAEMSYEELSEKTDLIFENVPDFCKLMIMKVDNSE